MEIQDFCGTAIHEKQVIILRLVRNFIKDFISNAPLEKMVLRLGSKEFVKEIHGQNIAITVKKDEYYTGGFSHRALANKVLYNRDQQISIFKEVLDVIKEVIS